MQDKTWYSILGVDAEPLSIKNLLLRQNHSLVLLLLMPKTHLIHKQLIFIPKLPGLGIMIFFLYQLPNNIVSKLIIFIKWVMF